MCAKKKSTAIRRPRRTVTGIPLTGRKLTADRTDRVWPKDIEGNFAEAVIDYYIWKASGEQVPTLHEGIALCLFHRTGVKRTDDQVKSHLQMRRKWFERTYEIATRWDEYIMAHGIPEDIQLEEEAASDGVPAAASPVGVQMSPDTEAPVMPDHLPQSLTPAIDYPATVQCATPVPDVAMPLDLSARYPQLAHHTVLLGETAAHIAVADLAYPAPSDPILAQHAVPPPIAYGSELLGFPSALPDTDFVSLSAPPVLLGLSAFPFLDTPALDHGALQCYSDPVLASLIAELRRIELFLPMDYAPAPSLTDAADPYHILDPNNGAEYALDACATLSEFAPVTLPSFSEQPVLHPQAQIDHSTSYVHPSYYFLQSGYHAC